MKRSSKHWLIALLSIMMAAAFMPAMIFAAENNGDLWYGYDDAPESMLPDDQGGIYEYFDFENLATGDFMELKITAVTSSNTSVVRVSRYEEGWEYWAIKEGTATLTVKFTDYNGKPNSYTKMITVTDEFMQLEVDSVGRDQVVPGGTIRLKASAKHRVFDDWDGPADGITYEWALENGGEKYARIDQDPADPSMAVITVNQNALESEDGDIDSLGLEVSVTASAQRVKGAGSVSAQKGWHADITAGYFDITPHNGEIDMAKTNATVTFTPQLIHYTKSKPEGTVIEGATFDLFYQDEEAKPAIRITKGEGGQYTLTRISKGSAELGMQVRYHSEDVDVDEQAYYYIPGFSVDLRDYNIYFKNLRNNDEFFVDEGGSIPMPKIEVWDPDNSTLSEDCYELAIYPLFWDQTGREKYGNPVDMSAGTLKLLPPAAGEVNWGQTAYRIVVTPKEGSGYTNSATRDLYLYSNKSLFNADIYMPGKYWVSTNGDEGYYRLTAGQTAVPSVKLNGQILKAGTQYKVEYVNNTNGHPQKTFPNKVGIYYCNAQGISPYYGGCDCDFRIVPKGTKIAKLKAGKKSFTVKWKKQTSQTKGYEIQYSLKKNFASGKKTVKIKKTKTTSKTIKKLKKKKVYYVRVRTYAKAGGTMLYSDWSPVKKVKTK